MGGAGLARTSQHAEHAGAPLDLAGYEITIPRSSADPMGRLAGLRHRRHADGNADNQDADHDEDTAARSLQAGHSTAKSATCRSTRSFVQRSDGRLGPGLKRIPDDECPPPGSPRRARPGGPPPPPPHPLIQMRSPPVDRLFSDPAACSPTAYRSTCSRGRWPTCRRLPSFNRPVTNLTKLEGVYDFDFRFTNEFGRGGPPPPGSPPAAPNAITPWGRTGALHGSAGAIGVEAEPASGDTGRPRDRSDRAAVRKLSRGTKSPLRVSNRAEGRRLGRRHLMRTNRPCGTFKTTRYPEQR